MMKTFTISVPTKKEEKKSSLMQLYTWMSHPGGMKRNKLLDIKRKLV